MSLVERDDIRRLTVDEYMKLVEVGILDEDEHVELIDGELVTGPPQEPPHSGGVLLLDDALRRAYGSAWVVRSQMPVITGGFSMPEPDICVVPGPIRRWTDQHPRGAQAALVAEVARTAIAKARRKASTFAAGDVPVYWLVDVVHRRIEVYEQPIPAERQYALARIVDASGSVAVPGTDVVLRVADLLPG